MLIEKIKHHRAGIAALLAILLCLSAATYFTNDQQASAVTTSGKWAYTVKTGDSLYLIANKCGLQVNDLIRANNLKSNSLFAGQTIMIPKYSYGNTSLKNILIGRGISIWNPNTKIVVDKSDHTLSIYSMGTLVKMYHVELGDNGLGDKKVSGDHKTPEGKLYIAEKSVLNPKDYYLGTRWMRLSYPNIEDANRGLDNGIISQSTHDSIVRAINNLAIPPQRTALGGGVGIHGGDIPSFGPDWTWGCVGLTNADVEDFYDFVKVGTAVVIQY
jgi:LysM repeat protein